MKDDKKKLKLVSKWVDLKMLLNKTEDALEEIYLKNPVKCENCGKVLKWKKRGWIDQNGYSLNTCECFDWML